MNRNQLRRRLAVAALLGTVVPLPGAGAMATTATAPLLAVASPVADPCAVASPVAGAGDMAGMDMGAATPAPGGMAGMDHSGMDAASPAAGPAVEFDRLYIDGMIPHHRSILAVAEAALPRLRDGRLVGIAEGIARTQEPEIEELRGLRERFYGGADPVSIDGQMMGKMARAMPGMGNMGQMDPAAELARFCAGAAADPDLAFIDLTIPHHEGAIAMSQAALGQALHDEIRGFAERVIRDQRREIDALAAVRAELYGSATPAPVGA